MNQISPSGVSSMKLLFICSLQLLSCIILTFISLYCFFKTSTKIIIINLKLLLLLLLVRSHFSHEAVLLHLHFLSYQYITFAQSCLLVISIIILIYILSISA